MTSTPKSAKHVSENDSPPSGTGAADHKSSFRSNKLARRARSFKDDFLGKISQMRSPVGQGARSHSPKNHPTPPSAIQHSKTPTNTDQTFTKGPIKELEELWKQIRFALRHFREIVHKNKLEVLPGNGTIVLDTVWLINLSVRSSVSADYSTSVHSATNRMYQSVARLIKLCDDVLIDDKTSELDAENVEEIVVQVEDAVKGLIDLARDKLTNHHQTPSYRTTPRSSYSNASLEMPAQRTSLPDIPLSPREREILEQTACKPTVRSSHSTESILRDTSPPPKPPLPEQSRPPPLPPKKKHQNAERSKSPEDSISLLSESAGSIESMLNYSREEDELKAIMDDCDIFDHHHSDIVGVNGSLNTWGESSANNNNNSEHIDTNNDYHRLSNTDSGIVSIRSSSYSKRSSQQSSTSSQLGKQSNVSEMIKSESMVQNFWHENQLSVSSSNFSSSHKTSSSSSSVTVSNESVFNRDETDLPPAIPVKTRKKGERQPSPYDNVPDDGLGGEVLVSCSMHQSQQSINTSSISSSSALDVSKPPPLPPKKKHIMAYMEMFGNCSHTSDQEYMRHSIHIHQSQFVAPPPTQGLPTTQSCSFHSTSTSSTHSHSSTHNHNQSINAPPSPTPTPTSILGALPPALPPKQRTRKSPPPTPTKHLAAPQIEAGGGGHSAKAVSPVLPDLLEHTATTTTSIGGEEKSCEREVGPSFVDLMEELNVEKQLVVKKSDEEGPEIRGGPIDALIIQATKATKNGEFTYQEAFLTTYRTFISPLELICKLIRRYNHFYSQPDKKPLSRGAFALMVRVVNDLTASDLTEELQQKLMQFVQQLISCGELTLAKALRVKHLERHEAKQMTARYTQSVTSTSLSLGARNCTLLDFKSEHIAEQMTLLDSELFGRIEIPEVLTWAQEQCEERSPNLTRFTEHFNKMSYWARTKILTAETKDIRERLFLKFIKIMKQLRRINNFNSYLAMLSALDSAPVRRLEWQKQVQEGLKEYCALIDSSSSFRAYRLALEATEPPCIPYIGLVLQDLTFVHIGNNNLLPDGTINFSKRWQQYNIVENMKKFKKGTYQFKKNERIIQFFQNFDDFINEDAMWQLSEAIKPRGGKKTT